ncbi:MAG TPA: formylglycine-generating enzyme family protein, partial [Myxococcota bacterium]|nr:formylglycine-generating enzyme family protein [Myxococcota bacterium]
ESPWHARKNWPKRVVWVLEAAPNDAEAKVFAEAALDSGSADVVVLGADPEWEAEGAILRVGLRPGESAKNVARITVPGWGEAAAMLRGVQQLQALPVEWSPENADQFRLAPTLTPPAIVWSAVPKGSFEMGSRDGDENEQPMRTVAVDAFEIGTYEVDNATYRAWDPEKTGEDRLPVVEVSWHEADAFCRWLGFADPLYQVRLPTEAEWEYAARGTDGRSYPWGNADPTAERAVFGGADLAAVDSLPAGRGPFGTYHQAGNVWEWVGDWYAPYDSQSVNNPTGPAVGRVLRGGPWSDDAVDLRSALRAWIPPSDSDDIIGFRCVRVPRPEP